MQFKKALTAEKRMPQVDWRALRRSCSKRNRPCRWERESFWGRRAHKENLRHSLAPQPILIRKMASAMHQRSSERGLITWTSLTRNKINCRQLSIRSQISRVPHKVWVKLSLARPPHDSFKMRALSYSFRIAARLMRLRKKSQKGEQPTTRLSQWAQSWKSTRGSELRRFAICWTGRNDSDKSRLRCWI